MEGNVEVSTTVATPPTPEEVQSSINAGYAKASGIEPETTQATETPPVKEADNELASMRTQVERIPDLLKRLDDVNGRYGRLSQRFEEMSQRLATPATPGAAAATVADASELLKDLNEEYPELAEKLTPAFNRMLESAKPGASAEEIQRAIEEATAARAKENLASAQNALAEAHPDWMTVRETEDYKAWLDSLTPRAKGRFLRSMDPDYVAEKLDDFKDWQQKRKETPPPPATTTNTVSKDRLRNAITPTNGAAQMPQVKSDKASIRAGYERVAGKRM